MSSPKLRKKLLAGILCVGMVFQSVPVNVSAHEDVEVIEENEIIETKTAEDEMQADTFTVMEPEVVQTEVSDKVLTETEEADTVLAETETSVGERNEETDRKDETTETEVAQSEAEENQIQTQDVVPLADDDENDLIDYTRLALATESTYYHYGEKLYIITKLSGCEIPDEVNIQFDIDDKICGTDADTPFGEVYTGQAQEGFYIIILKKGDLETSRSHKIRVILTKETAGEAIRELVRREAVFTIAEQDIFLEKTPYYMGVSDENVEVTIFNTADDIDRVALSNNGETVAAPTEDSVPVKASIKTDPRYTGICKDYEFPDDILPASKVLLYKSTWTLTNLKNAIDLGNYNLHIIFDNEDTMDLNGAVSITSDAVVTNCTIAVDYDNTSPYAYLFIQGSGFDPARVTYNFKRGSATGSPLRSTRISAKEVWSGYIVKFQKIGDWPSAGEDIYVSLRGNNIRFSKSEFTSTVQSGIYYAEYNPVLKAVEVGVTVDLDGKRTKFTIVDSKEATEGNPTTINSLTDSLIYLTPQNSLKAGKQYVKLVVESQPAYFKEFNVDAKALDTSKWDAPKVISKNAVWHYFYYYYDEAGITSSDLSATITGSGVSMEAVVSAEEWLREDTGMGTSIKVVIPTEKLEIGKYTVEIFKNEDDTKSRIDFHEFEIVAAQNNKFILDEYSISWVDDDTMQVYIKTPNCSEEDMFDIKLTGTGTGGREVEDLNAVITNRYSDSVYMEVTGLKRTKAFRDYYVLLTHHNKDYQNQGYPYRMSNMEPYYAENEMEKGELKTIAFNRGMPIKVTANNRVVGINLQYMTLPATVRLYAPNDTDVLANLTIMAATEDDYYYFTKAFYDSLPNKDTLYDMVISDADGWGRTYPGVTIGYRGETVQNDFKVAITTDILFLGAEGEDTAVITVTENKQKPAFEVNAAGEDIITVTADETDPNKAVVRAAEKTGTAIVTVFADGVQKSIIVTVTAKVDSIVLDTSNKNMWVGDTYDVKVYTLPIGSEDSTHIMTFISSDPSVLYVKQLTATTARITAMGSGTATLRVSLNGTAHITSMSVSVTGIFSLTEKKEKIAEAGISSYIENVDRSLEYCELPEGWQWDDGSISLSASDDAPVQYYGATYRQEGYESFSARLPVAVTRITGINIEGRNLINRGKEETYSVTYQYVGRNITWSEIDKRLSVNCVKVTDGDIAEVTSVDKEQVVITAKEETEGGTVEFRFTLSIDNGTIEGSDMLVEVFHVTVPAEDCVDNIVLTPVNEEGFIPERRLLELDVNKVKAANGKYPVSIALEATINGVPAKNIAFEWKSSDENIASFTIDKNDKTLATDQKGNVVLTIKSVGIVEITATATDAGAFVGTLTINVMDYEPVLETSVITVNKNSTAGTKFALQEQNGNTIRKITVLEQDAKSPNFTVKLPENGMATMTIIDNSPAKNYDRKTTSNVILEVETIKGGRYQYPVSVVTEVSVPKATVKLSKKANLFYANASAVYTISSNYEIASVTDVGSTEYEERFYGTYDKSNKTITFNTKGTLDSKTVGLFTASKSPRLETRLRINFAGYNEPQYINVKVATENKKPSLSITGIAVCPNMIEGMVNVVDTKTKENLILNSKTTELTMPQPVNSLTVPTINSDGSMSLSYYGNKSISYIVAIRNREWTQPVNAKGKITYVKSPELLKLAIGKKQLTLNVGTNISDHGENSIPVSVSGNSIPIAELFYDGTAKSLIDNKVLSYKYDSRNQTIKLGLIKNSKGSVKAGSYKLNLYATIMVGENPVTIKKETLTIKIMDEKAAKVTMSSPKGKINLIERNTTSIVYTPKVSGIESSVKSVRVTGDNQKFFTASINSDKKIEVKAKAGVEGMSSKTTYSVPILSTLENGYQIETIVKIKPINKLPKIVLSPSAGNLYRMNSNKYVTSLSFKDSSLGLDSIAGITLDMSSPNAEIFSLSNDVSRNGTISFALAGDKLKIKTGKYKLKCQVRFRDADVDVKPTTVNIEITVK